MHLLKRIMICIALLLGGVVANETTVEECVAYCGPVLNNTKFTGKIGGKYGITMDIFLPQDKDFGISCNISGSYYYGNGKNGSLQLSGRYENGRIWMNEYNSKGEYCGSWDVTIRRSGNGKTMTGTMTNSKGKRYSVSCRSRY